MPTLIRRLQRRVGGPPMALGGGAPASPDLVFTQGVEAENYGTTFNYYVDGTGGSNGNAGTSVGAAWATLDKAFDFLNANPPGGDVTVGVRAGTYREKVSLESRTYLNKVGLYAYDGETAKATGCDVVTGWVEADSGDTLLGGNFAGRYKKIITAPSTGDRSILGVLEAGAPLAWSRNTASADPMFAQFITNPDTFHTSDSNAVDDAGNVESITAFSLFAPYVQAQIEQAFVKYHGFPNLSVTGLIMDHETATGTATLGVARDEFTVNTTTDQIISAGNGRPGYTSANNFSGSIVVFTSTGTLPAGLSAGTDYYILDSGPDFQVSLTSGGAAVDITDAGTGTHTFTVRPSNTPQQTPVKFGLYNVLEDIQQGQMGVVDNFDGTWTVYIFPNDTGNLTANIEITVRDGVIDTSSADNIELYGLELYGSRIDPAFGNTGGGATSDNCRAENVTFTHHFGAPRGAGPISFQGSGLRVKNHTIDGVYDSYAYYARAGSNNYIWFGDVIRCENSPARMFGQVEAAVLFTGHRLCGAEAHSNLGNYYLGGDKWGFWGNSWRSCKGYVTFQDSNRGLIGMNFMDRVDGINVNNLVVVNQNRDSGSTAPTPGGPVYVFNNHALPLAADLTSVAMQLGTGSTDANVPVDHARNNVCIFIDNTGEADELGDRLGNVLIGTAQDQGDTDVEVAPTAVYANPAAGDFSIVANSPLFAAGEPLTDLTATFEAWFANAPFDFWLYDADGFLLGSAAPRGHIKRAITHTTTPSITLDSVEADGETDFAASFTPSSDTGRVWWVATTSTTRPSTAQIKAGQDNSGIAAADSGNQAVRSTASQGLTTNGTLASTTQYTLFLHYEDWTEAAATDESAANAIDTTPVPNPHNEVAFGAGVYAHGFGLTLGDGLLIAGRVKLTVAPAAFVYFWGDTASNTALYWDNSDGKIKARLENTVGTSVVLASAATFGLNDEASILVRAELIDAATASYSLIVNNATPVTATAPVEDPSIRDMKMPAQMNATSDAGANSQGFNLIGGWWIANALGALGYGDLFNVADDLPTFNQSTIGGVQARFFQMGVAQKWIDGQNNGADGTFTMVGTPTDVA